MQKHHEPFTDTMQEGVSGQSLRGRTALITGSGRGIGRAIARMFAAHGAAVAVAARTQREIDLVAAECAVFGVDAISIALDVTSRQACDESVARCVERWGRLDILVNNAGVASAQKFLEIDDETWDHVIRTDLTGPFWLTRAALPGMLSRRDGSVIAIDSIAGKIGGAYIAPYSASKHGLLGLMRSLAAEYPRSGVTFNSVCPAYVDTPMTERTVMQIMERTGRTRDEALRALETPQGRLVAPGEVAAVCLLLAGPMGRGINGQAINVDGGQVPW